MSKDINAKTDKVDKEIGRFIGKRCPRCGSELLGNKLGDEWCSFVGCSYGTERQYDNLQIIMSDFICLELNVVDDKLDQVRFNKK